MSSDCRKRRRLDGAGDGEEEVDRISALPDEIIHQIFDRLQSPEEAAKTSVLSPRWFNLWRSYPILECGYNLFRSKQSVETFAAAAAEKFSTQLAVEAIRIKLVESLRGNTNNTVFSDQEFCSVFLDDMLQLAANKSPPPQEIEIGAYFGREIFPFYGYGTYTIPRGLLLPKSRLTVLKLTNCNFDQYRDINNVDFVGLGSSLRNLRLTCVSFPSEEAGDRILNSIIAGASLLRRLVLSRIKGIRRLQVRDLPNLNELWLTDCNVEDLEIAGVNSLEFLHIEDAPLGGDFVVSSMPNLKKLVIEGVELTEQKLEELISKSPSLESLWLKDLDNVHKLKIVNSDKLWRVQVYHWRELESIDLDTPNMSHFYYLGRIDCFLAVLAKAGSYCKETDQPLYARYSCYGINVDDFDTLSKFLEQLTQCSFRLAVEFGCLPHDGVHGNQTQEERSIMEIEHVKLPWNFYTLHNNNSSLDYVFQNFHPNYFSFDHERDYDPTTSFLAPKYICEQFMERDSLTECGTACKCWRHQLKDMKIIKRAKYGRIKVQEEDKVMDISPNICSSLAEMKQILLLPTWNKFDRVVL